MNTSFCHFLRQIRRLWLLVPLGPLLALPAQAACPAGQVELLPNLRAMPPRDIAMLDANNIKFSATSWNAGDGKLELVPRSPENDPATGQRIQPVDQRIYCSGGAYYDEPAGKAEYHPEHNHVHFNDYANYILEQDTASPQNPRQGTKTTFCIMDTTAVNLQLAGAASTAAYATCPTQDPNFNTQGMSVGWGDTYGSYLAGQSLYVGDLAPGMYRLRHVFDPKNLLSEIDETDNESCRRIEIGDGSSGRYVADRGPCTTVQAPRLYSLSPASASHNSCVAMTISGAYLVPEAQVMFSGGTGPLPKARGTRVDLAGNFITTTVCIPRAKGSDKQPRLGADPVWDAQLLNYLAPNSNALVNAFRVLP